MGNDRKDIHTIDTRFTFSGPRAREFIELAKEEFGMPLPYGAIRQLIRLACVYYLEARRKARNQESSNEETTI